MLDEAKRLNYVAYVAWGGEPLMRPDIMEILQHSRDLGLYTSVITNGTLLPERAEKIAKIADLTWVSLDHDSEFHNEMRGRSGVYQKALEGIAKLRKAGGRVVINCVLSKLNMDAAKKVAEVARRLRVRVAFDPMEIFPGNNSEHALAPQELRSMFSEIRELKDQGYPILNSYEFIDHITNPIEYSCAQPQIFTWVSANGKVEPFWCQRTRKVLGDLRKQSLSEVLHSHELKEFTELAKGCNICGNSSTVECAVFYSAKRFLTNLFNPTGPYLKFILDFATN